jgi:hypothetical protein
MKKPTIFYRPVGGSAPLSVYWYEQGALGDAVEALNETGVGWFSPNGELLAVQFDDVREAKDHQILEFTGYRVEIAMKQGKAAVKVEPAVTKKVSA